MQSSQVKATRTFDDKSIEIYWIIGQKTWETRGDAMPVIQCRAEAPNRIAGILLASLHWSLKVGLSSTTLANHQVLLPKKGPTPYEQPILTSEKPYLNTRKPQNLKTGLSIAHTI